MKKHIGCLRAVVLLLGFSVAAIAQTPPAPTPLTRYDGTYAFIAATKVNEWRGPAHIGRCGNMGSATPLVIVNGHAHYTTASGYFVEGVVGSQGELSMHYPPDPVGRFAGPSPGVERPVYGQIDGDGTVRARQIGNWCSHDMIWRKATK